MPPDSWLHGLESVRCTPGHKAGSASVPSASRLAFAGPLAVVHLHLSLISQVVCNYSQAVRRNPKISSVGITIALDRGNDWSAYSKENGSGNSGFRLYCSWCHALSAIHRRRVSCVYKRLLQVPE